MASQKAKKKSTNFTGEEQELLMALVKTHKDVIDNKKSGQTTWDMKHNVWITIEQEFNSQSKSTFRDAQSLKTKFRNMKKECKQKFSSNKRSLLKTGGGPPEKVDITSIDLEMKDLMGNISVDGLPAIYDDDYEDDRIQHNLTKSQLEEMQIELIDEAVSNDVILVGEGVINNKLIVAQGHNSPRTSSEIELFTPTKKIEESSQKCETQTTKTGSKLNWSQYSSAMLQEPVDKKLKTNSNGKNDSGNQRNKRGTKKKLACTKSQLYEQVMEAKLNFIQLQEEKFLEEHRIRKRILEVELKLKRQQLLHRYH